MSNFTFKNQVIIQILFQFFSSTGFIIKLVFPFPILVPIPQFSDPSHTCSLCYSPRPRSFTLYIAVFLSLMAIPASLGVHGIPCLLILIIILLMVLFGSASRLSKSSLEMVKASYFHWRYTSQYLAIASLSPGAGVTNGAGN